MKCTVFQSFRKFSLTLVAVIIAVSSGGCGKKAVVTPASVEWPELIRFDALLEETEKLVMSGEMLAALKNRQILLEAGWAVAPPTVPANVTDMEKVRPLLGDLVSKLNGLAVPSLEPEKLKEIILGIRPILIELFEAAGVEPSLPDSGGPNASSR